MGDRLVAAILTMLMRCIMPFRRPIGRAAIRVLRRYFDDMFIDAAAFNVFEVPLIKIIDVVSVPNCELHIPAQRSTIPFCYLIAPLHHTAVMDGGARNDQIAPKSPQPRNRGSSSEPASLLYLRNSMRGWAGRRSPVSLEHLADIEMEGNRPQGRQLRRP